MEKKLILFFKELGTSDWHCEVPFCQRGYNGIPVLNTENTYCRKIESMYYDAVVSLINVPLEKSEILQNLLEEISENQKLFEFPPDEILDLLLNDYIKDNNQVYSLKEDYDYLCFVRNCMLTQKHYLEKFKNKITLNKQKEIIKVDEQKTISPDIRNEDELINGIRGLAGYLKISPKTAQEIIKSNILKDNGIAYRVGKKWNINKTKLVETLKQKPDLLKKHK